MHGGDTRFRLFQTIHREIYVFFRASSLRTARFEHFLFTPREKPCLPYHKIAVVEQGSCTVVIPSLSGIRLFKHE